MRTPPTEGTRMKKPKTLIPDAEVAERYKRHISTVANWDKDPDLNFPKAIRINRRKYRDSDELDAFDRARAAERDDAA
jgi:hypothetical protein